CVRLKMEQNQVVHRNIGSPKGMADNHAFRVAEIAKSFSTILFQRSHAAFFCILTFAQRALWAFAILRLAASGRVYVCFSCRTRLSAQVFRFLHLLKIPCIGSSQSGWRSRPRSLSSDCGRRRTGRQSTLLK